MACGAAHVASAGGAVVSWEFFEERKVTARKAHRCMECPEQIKPGDRYSYGFGLCEGDPCENKLCLTCRALVDAACAWFCFDDGWPLELRSYLRGEEGVEDWRAWLVWVQAFKPMSS